MTPDALRRYALSLPETNELPHFERASFRTRGRIFATLARDGGEAMVKLADPAEAEDLIEAEPELFFAYGGWTARQGALGVRLRAAPAARVRALVRAAWEALASQRARAALAGPRKRR